MIEGLKVTATATIVAIDETVVRGEYHNKTYTLSVDDDGRVELYTVEAFNKDDSEYQTCSDIDKFNKVGDLVDFEGYLGGARAMWQGPEKNGIVPFPKAFIKLKHFKLSKSTGLGAASDAAAFNDVDEEI